MSAVANEGSSGVADSPVLVTTGVTHSMVGVRCWAAHRWLGSYFLSQALMHGQELYFTFNYYINYSVL